MKKIIFTYIIVGSLLTSCKEDDNNNVSTKDKTFLQKAAPANQAEIELGQVAASRSTTDMIKAFGNMMATEHDESLADLKNVATSSKVSVSTTLDREHQSMKARLLSLSGHTLDTAYIHGQVKDHQKTIALYQSELDSGSSPGIKSYAGKYLPHIKMHLQKADSIWNLINH